MRGEREVVRHRPRVAGHLADHPVASMDDDGLGRLEIQAKRRVPVHRGQHLHRAGFVARAPLDAPVAVPHAPRSGVGAGNAGTGAVQTFVDDVAPGLRIGDRELREMHLPEVPGRSPPRLDGSRPAEERQLESEVPSRRVEQVAGVVPPFGPELRMPEVIAREFERVARNRPCERRGRAGRIVRRSRRGGDQHGGKTKEPGRHHSSPPATRRSGRIPGARGSVCNSADGRSVNRPQWAAGPRFFERARLPRSRDTPRWDVMESEQAVTCSRRVLPFEKRRTRSAVILLSGPPPGSAAPRCGPDTGRTPGSLPG